MNSRNLDTEIAEKKDPMDAFHAHLDSCKHCEQHPFDLCIIGRNLIIIAANETFKALSALKSKGGG